ncbi:MAG: succinate dehydrogenase cytochrome b subunit [Candidatus Eisenbacteria bacterium]
MSGTFGFYQSTIGKKIVVGVTGALLVGFVCVHMIGNLQAWEGPGDLHEKAKLTQYGELLRKEMAILWAARLTLIAAVVLHVVTTLRLAALNRAARPQRYAAQRTMKTTLAARTMVLGGLSLFAYVVYHILHLTAGRAHSDLFRHGDVFGNVARSFSHPVITAIYCLAMVPLFFHLRHGILSACRTLGVSHPEHLARVEQIGTLLALVVALGFASVPLGVLFGMIHL